MNNNTKSRREEVLSQYHRLPQSLRENARFCLWRYEERDGKPTKVPYQVNGRRADSTGITTFASFEEVACRSGWL